MVKVISIKRSAPVISLFSIQKGNKKTLPHWINLEGVFTCLQELNTDINSNDMSNVCFVHLNFRTLIIFLNKCLFNLMAQTVHALYDLCTSEEFQSDANKLCKHRVDNGFWLSCLFI